MKKLFATLVLFVLAQSAFAQSLSYTKWFGTKPPSPNLWFNFGVDTLYYSTNNSLFLPLSAFSSNNGSFVIRDLSGSAACMDTGFYNYVITGNNLSFSLVVDNCVSRKNTILNYTWTALNTSVSGIDPVKTFTFSTVSKEEGIFNFAIREFCLEQNSLFIYDLAGKCVYQEVLKASNTKLNLGFLPKGIYCCVYTSLAKHDSFKISR